MPKQVKPGKRQKKSKAFLQVSEKKVRKKTAYKLPPHITKSTCLKSTDFFNNKFEIVRFLSKGVSTALFFEIKKDYPFTDKDWATYLDISLKTLQRYIKNEAHIFKPSQAEKVIEFLEVMKFGNTVFDTPEQFQLWLKTPNYALGNTKPIELIKNSYGKELVMETLNRIEHGIFV